MFLGFIQWRIVAGLLVLEKVLVTVLLRCPSKESSLCTVLKTCHEAPLSCLLFLEANMFLFVYFFRFKFTDQILWFTTRIIIQ